MDQLWIDEDRGTVPSSEHGAPPMSQQEALAILKAVAQKYTLPQLATPKLDDWVAGCTEDFGD